jgi:hypothetical protein
VIIRCFVRNVGVGNLELIGCRKRDQFLVDAYHIQEQMLSVGRLCSLDDPTAQSVKTLRVSLDLMEDQASIASLV